MGLRIVTATHTIDVPQAIEAEGAAEVERYVAEECVRLDVVTIEAPPPDPSQTAGADS